MTPMFGKELNLRLCTQFHTRTAHLTVFVAEFRAETCHHAHEPGYRLIHVRYALDEAVHVRARLLSQLQKRTVCLCVNKNSPRCSKALTLEIV